jgi:allantoate deiminase
MRETTEQSALEAGGSIRIDRRRSAQRILADVTVLSGAEYTLTPGVVCRYAYSEPYARTIGYFRSQLEELGFEVTFDPLGTLVARNRPPGEPAFGVGSHCDSVRSGGPWDGTLGVAVGVEVCRLSRELGLDLPLQVVSFLEEDGSGFGQVLLGSSLVGGRLVEEDLHRITSVDDGRSLWVHSEAAGYAPSRWRDAPRILDGLLAWVETHIEQARILEDARDRLGVVSSIAGYVHGDITVHGRADHAGGTPMWLRSDPVPIAAACIVETERLARAAGNETVATVGQVEVTPGIINGIASSVRFSLDVRGVKDSAFRGLTEEIVRFAVGLAAEHGMRAEYRERGSMPATRLDEGVVRALEDAARATGEPYRAMHSGGAHDTMNVAPTVPSAMLFIPCRGGVSHAPTEHADADDAALAAEVTLNALVKLAAT